VIIVFDGDTGDLEVADGPDNPLLVHVPPWVIVPADDEYAGVVSADEQDKPVQRLEVVVISGQKHARPLNGLQQMFRVRRTDVADVMRDDDIVSGRSQHLYENAID
jgi:hypothetical protein